ncbi:MAG: hypothetical protein DHS20C18_54830 [Saprospiraceae bacterium]|nr:MAG: hypothetical protein DHS20C18_54830 [Saprospiraceae bacterium]
MLTSATLSAQGTLSCGAWLIDTTTYDSEIEYPFSDRFGNKYLRSDLTLSRNPVTPCDCSEFSDTEVPNLSQSIFDITFLDCVEGTGIGFNDFTNGEEYRRVMCKVYAELSQLVTQADDPCTGDDPPKVNISVLTSNGTEANMLPSNAFAGGSAVYDCAGQGGVLTGLVWDVINGGVDVNSDENDEVAHGVIVLNIDPVVSPPDPPFAGYYTGDSSDPMDIGSFHDLYTILLHEAVHTLGFSAQMTSNGFPNNDHISYTLFATHLRVIDFPGPLLPVIERNINNPFRWTQAIPSTSFYGSCLPNSNPDMFFINQNGTSATIFTGAQHVVGTSFSHLADNCNGPFLMGEEVDSGERKPLTESEKDILCSLGYSISAISDCGCKVVGVDDYGPACLEPDGCITEAFEFSLCDGEIFNFPLSNLLNNDINADGILDIKADGANISVSNGIVEFEPCSSGQFKIAYEPYSNSCSQLGNVTFAIINVKPCVGCLFADEQAPVDGGYNHNSCNLVCNPEVYANDNSISRNSFGCICIEGFELPGWYAAVGTADYSNNTIFNGSGSLKFLWRYSPPDGNVVEESPYTPIELPGPGKYFYSYYYRVTSSIPPSNLKYSIHSALVDETIQCQFGACTINENALLDFEIGKIEEIHLEEQNSLVSSFTRTGSCFSWDDLWTAAALWVYPEAESVQLGTGYDFFLDQIELIPDNFPEDETISAICETSVALGGKMYCQPSGTTVKYTWTDESSNVLAMYQVVSDDAGDQTVLDMNGDPMQDIPFITCTVTSTACCTLTRIFTDDGGLDLTDCQNNTYKVTIDADGENTFGCASCNTSNTVPSGYKLGDAITSGILDNLPATNAQTVCIEGTLEIDFDYNFINSQLNMLPGSKIVVKDGAYLTLYNTRLSGCTAMWAGIEIEKGGGIKMSNSTISDAQYGIYLHPATPFGGTAPTAEIIASTFCDNFIGVFASATTNGKVNALIAENTFSNYQNLLPPYSGQASASGLPEQDTRSLAGMYLKNISAFLSRNNDFNGLTSGIVSLTTNLQVSGGMFTEMVTNQSYYPTYAPRGTALYSSAMGGHLLVAEGTLIMDCVKGIIASFSPLNATGNTMLNVDWGIIATLPSTGTGNIIIGGMDQADKNTIQSNALGIGISNPAAGGQVLVGNNEITTEASAASGKGIGFEFHAAPTQVIGNTIHVNQKGVGLFLQAAKNIEITDNNQIVLADEALARAGVTLQAATNCLLSEVQVDGDGTGGADNYGIEILSSPGNKYCCNELDKTRVGVQVDGGSSSEDHFSGTIFGDHHYGLLIPSSGILGTQTHQENQWTGIYGADSAAVYQVDQQTAANLPFIFDDSENSYFEAPNASPVGWFVSNENLNPTDVCAPENCVIDDIKQDSPDTKRIAGDSIQAGDYTSTVQWELNRYLYKKIDGVSITEQEIQDFVDHHDTTTVGAFHAIDLALANIYQADIVEIDQINENLDSIRSILNAIADIDTALLNATGTTYQTLWQSRTQKIDDLLDYNKDNVSLLQSLATSRGTASASIMSQNASITVDSIYEQNEKTVNGIYAGYLNKGLTKPDTADLNALQAVADQCPLEGGNAVYKARALLKLMIGVDPVYDDQQACLGSQAFAMPEPEVRVSESSDWRIYPNPATEEVMIDWSGQQFETGTLQLFDLNGKLLKKQIFTKEEVKTRMSTAELQGGIYLLVLQLDQKQPATKKLAIIHR